MPKFKVPATMTTELYIIVDAKDIEHAKEIGKNTDGGEFTEDESPSSGSWEVGEPTPYIEGTEKVAS